MKKTKFKMPTALSIVMIFLLIVVVLTWVVPVSVVTVGENGERIVHYNSTFDADGNVVENAGTAPKGLWNLFLAPILGFISASDVAATIFISGGALAILAHVGALDAGINSLLKRYKGNTLIVLLMLVFALMGTVYGAWEELPAYAIVIIPLFLAAGYDAVTGIFVILVGVIIGSMASIVNPYSVGAAVAAIGNPDLTLGSGIVLRIVLFVAMFVVGAGFVLKYAGKVKKDPTTSCIAGVENIIVRANTGERDLVEMTKKRKWSLVVFFFMVLACVMGYIPWGEIALSNGKTAFDYINGFIPALNGTFIGNFLGTNDFNPFGWWYFNEFSLSWLVGSVVIALINKIPEKDFVNVFIKGAADLTGVVLVLSVARGIAITMGSKTEGMSITFIYWIKSLLEGVPLWAFAVAAVLVYMLIGLFLQSTSGVAGITMPIFGAVAMALFASASSGVIGGQTLLLSAFPIGLGFTGVLYPSATTMGILEMANVPFDKYLVQLVKFMVPILVTGVLILSVAPYIGLV